LPPVLRQLGDKHGNLVIAAVPNKHIMVKGPADSIESAKPGLLEIFEEYFPDAPIPPALGGGAGEEEPMEEEPEVPEPPAPPPKPAEPEPQKAAAPATSVMSGVRAMLGGRGAAQQAAVAPAPKQQRKPVKGRKQPAPMPPAPSALLWECTRKNSSFIRNPYRGLKKPFSAEPVNLMGVHAARFSGIASTEAVDVRPVKAGDKESIVLSQSQAKSSRQRRPSVAILSRGLSKCPSKGLDTLEVELDAKYYRRGLYAIARTKYLKVQKSFKKKKPAVKSRRMKT